MKTDKASEMIIVPYWPTQIWFPAFPFTTVDKPFLMNVSYCCFVECFDDDMRIFVDVSESPLLSTFFLILDMQAE
jgi:hypothetical protein